MNAPTASPQRPTIGIALGDIGGIGPEVTLKALAQAPIDDTRYVVIGDVAHLQKLNQKLGLKVVLDDPDGRITIVQPLTESLPTDLPAGSPVAARAAVAWLRESARRCLSGEMQAMVTAPVNKESIIRSGETKFVGQTEFLSEIAGTDRSVMMLLGCDDRQRWLRVALVTNHLAVRKIADAITGDKVELAIERAAQACHDLGLPRRRIAVCGLNPHAGEGGKMGDEEITTIRPAVERMAKKGVDVLGPIPADTLFHYAYRGDYDAVVAMYHDQGLAPLKMIGFESGINWTLGLPFIRTSPDHGTAYDIAGQGKADYGSMTAAMNLAVRLAREKQRT